MKEKKEKNDKGQRMVPNPRGLCLGVGRNPREFQLERAGKPKIRADLWVDVGWNPRELDVAEKLGGEPDWRNPRGFPKIFTSCF